MRILLAGCEGQLGRALNHVLPGYGDLHAFSKTEFDLSCPATMESVLEEVRPGLIVNAAAFTNVDLAETERETALAVNATGPGVMACWAARNEAKVLHYSTDYVFDGESDRPYQEDDLTNPLNVYGVTKLAGEHAVTESGARHLIIRTSWLYDADGHNFLNTIRRLVGEREELRIVDDQFGAPTPAWWLAEVTVRLLSQDACGILHAASAGVTSWYGFACLIIDELRKRGLPVKVTHVTPIESGAYPTAAKRPRNSVFALARLSGEFGIAPPSWQDALLPVLDQLSIQGRGR